jgi:basic amino acid/polyamine antiporter, APA family
VAACDHERLLVSLCETLDIRHSAFVISLMPNESIPPHVTERAEELDHQLIRAIGVPGLTANIVNSTIGAGIFVLPALVAKNLGAAAPLAFLACAVAMVLFVTCFAIAGSRVSLTGGLYAYVEVAFGRYVGFLAGILYCLTAVCAVAGVVNVFANSIAGLVPALSNPLLRILLIACVYGVLLLINIRGVRGGAGAVTIVTPAKLLPLALFLVVGIFYIHPANFAWPGWPQTKDLNDSIILLMFAFVGIEVALIPSGEVKNPSRTVPRSVYLALLITTFIYLMIQVVAQGTLGASLAQHPKGPLAEAAATFLGPTGRKILLGGATISAVGFVTSDILSSPRMIFAFGRDGSIPSFFAHVHKRFRSPDVAIVTYTVIAFALSISGSFERLAVLSNVAVLLMYLLCCLACWFLVQRDVRAEGPPLNFPGMQIIPILAIAVNVWILAQSAFSATDVGSDTRAGLGIAAIVVAVASVGYFAGAKLWRRA